MDSEIISREIILKLITNTIYTNENKRINQEKGENHAGI